MDSVNQLDLYILREMSEGSRLPVMCKTAVGRESLNHLVSKQYISKTGEGLNTTYQVTEKGLGLVNSEEIEMEEETLQFAVVDECNLWTTVIKTQMEQGRGVEAAIATADIAVNAFRERGTTLYESARALQKLIDDRNRAAQGEFGLGDGGEIVPFKEDN